MPIAFAAFGWRSVRHSLTVSVRVVTTTAPLRFFASIVKTPGGRFHVVDAAAAIANWFVVEALPFSAIKPAKVKCTARLPRAPLR